MDENELLFLPADNVNSVTNTDDIEMCETENIGHSIETNTTAPPLQNDINLEVTTNDDNKIPVDDSGFVEGNNLPKNNVTLSSDILEEKDETLEEDPNGEASTSNQNLDEPQLKILRKRNYRSRIMRASTSSSSSLDSDDTNTPPEEQNNDPILPLDSETDAASSPIIPHLIRHLDNDNDDNDEDHEDIIGDSSDTLSSGYMHYSHSDSEDDDNNNLSIVQDLLAREKPKYGTNIVYELMCRENGLSTYNRTKSQKNNGPVVFQNRLSSSRKMIEKMKFLHALEKHRGCVNSLNYNRAGTLLCTGSDDLKIILWNWSTKKVKFSFQSGHHSNVFQTKFIELPSGGLNIASSARDGQVHHAIIPPSGGKKVISTVLCKHVGAVHKIAICPSNTYEILTAGEDGEIIRCDLRDKPIEKLVSVKVADKLHKVPLYSIAHHPSDPEFCVCGRDQFVRVYDKRNCKTTLREMYPEHLSDKKPFVSHITCAVYSNLGNEILASYSNEFIYLFDNKSYVPGHFIQKYQGHNNNKTIKGVNFFGPNSDYVVSGSDCGNIFFWDKYTGCILNWLNADRQGIVNCLEPHPTFPILATSGLDYDAKIWAPISENYPPPMQNLEKCVKHNLKISSSNDPELFDDRTFLFFVRQCMRNRTRETATTNRNCPYVQDLASSSDDDEEDAEGEGDHDGDADGIGDGDGFDEDDGEETAFRSLPCTTQ